MTEPRFLLIDTDTGKRVALTTDEVRAELFRVELQQPGDGAYFEKQGDDNGFRRSVQLDERRPLAQRVGGAWYYIQMLEKLSKDWRNDTIRAMYDTGNYAAKDLGRIFRLSHRQVQNILAAPGSQKELEEKQLKLF